MPPSPTPLHPWPGAVGGQPRCRATARPMHPPLVMVSDSHVCSPRPANPQRLLARPALLRRGRGAGRSCRASLLLPRSPLVVSAMNPPRPLLVDRRFTPAWKSHRRRAHWSAKGNRNPGSVHETHRPVCRPALQHAHAPSPGKTHCMPRATSTPPSPLTSPPVAAPLLPPFLPQPRQPPAPATPRRHSQW